MKFKRPDGRTVRPSLVVLDDPQTDESARSLSQCANRESILAGQCLVLLVQVRRSRASCHAPLFVLVIWPTISSIAIVIQSGTANGPRWFINSRPMNPCGNAMQSFVRKAFATVMADRLQPSSIVATKRQWTRGLLLLGRTLQP